MNEIAILIIAHKNQHQLELLLRNLADDFDLYVHIDKTSAINKEELTVKYPKIRFYSELHVVWGGYNLSACSLFLFQQAYKGNYKYYALISGQDLPLLSNEEIKNFIYKNDSSYIVSDKLPIKHWAYNGGINRYELYWEHDITGNSLWDTFRRKLIGNIRKIQLKYNIRRPFYKRMDVYGGSNWVLLKQDAMDYLISFIDENPRFMKRLKYCFCTDELWMQTILATSNCNIKNEHFTYLDWGTGPEYPRTLRMEDYNKIVESPYPFARKFDSEVDNEIIEKLLDSRNSTI